MKRFGLVVLACMPGSVFADVAADKAALSKAIEAAGWVVTAENGDEIFQASGLTEEQVFAAVAALYESGQAVLQPDGSMSLQTEACK